jgi:hypothetical protein
MKLPNVSPMPHRDTISRYMPAGARRARQSPLPESRFPT